MRQIMRSSLDYAGFAQLCWRSPIMREIMRAHNRIIPRSLHDTRSLPAPCWARRWRESPSMRTFVPSPALLAHNSHHWMTSLKLRSLNARQASQLGQLHCSTCSGVPQRTTLHRRTTSIIISCRQSTVAANAVQWWRENEGAYPPLFEFVHNVSAIWKTVLSHWASH